MTYKQDEISIERSNEILFFSFSVPYLNNQQNMQKACINTVSNVTAHLASATLWDPLTCFDKHAKEWSGE